MRHSLASLPSRASSASSLPQAHYVYGHIQGLAYNPRVQSAGFEAALQVCVEESAGVSAKPGKECNPLSMSACYHIDEKVPNFYCQGLRHAVG